MRADVQSGNSEVLNLKIEADVEISLKKTSDSERNIGVSAN